MRHPDGAVLELACGLAASLLRAELTIPDAERPGSSWASTLCWSDGRLRSALIAHVVLL